MARQKCRYVLDEGGSDATFGAIVMDSLHLRRGENEHGLIDGVDSTVAVVRVGPDSLAHQRADLPYCSGYASSSFRISASNCAWVQ